MLVDEASQHLLLVNRFEALFSIFIQIRIKRRSNLGGFTYRPAPSCLPCLSLKAGRGHLLTAFPSAGICSGPGSAPPTSGSVTAVTRSLTQQRSPCYLGHEFTKFCITFKKKTKTNPNDDISHKSASAAEVSELTVFRCRLRSCTLCQQASAW